MHNTKPRSDTADAKLSSKNTACSAKLSIRLQKSAFKQKGTVESSAAYKRASQYVSCFASVSNMVNLCMCLCNICNVLINFYCEEIESLQC